MGRFLFVKYMMEDKAIEKASERQIATLGGNLLDK